MKKLGLGIAMAAALMLAMAPAVQEVRAAAPKQQKTLGQGFAEELGKIGKPAEKVKPAKKKKAKKADKKK